MVFHCHHLRTEELGWLRIVGGGGGGEGGICCAMHEKDPHAVCGQISSRSSCKSVQSNLGIFCLLTYTTESTDFVS